ncbi:bifunctional ornithine acetyltransferase/N-acetylglutamate synthase [Anaeromicrobium sediminis]|uniref:Arginine biosynthesis bifunctional protein ArgJ n=1 Tax=Anaeromicrobium sediminis TaxID=1478221 RepID=A0A267MMK6_9FIRM|nr:bifunctional ornithine acetyltransferase/N-acetylglutamate synthase [Anaeromicrobium sediminis]PAB60667.1 bifunctional ornithine acetyltransferase/N-acetylglutamate synthase [Anaeromicrobium sediminis]
MKLIKGGVISPKGFMASGIYSGVKRKRKDLSLIYCKGGTTTVGMFTTNKVKAAPVLVNEETLNKNNNIKALVINSGVANACTGKKGYEDAKEMTKITGQSLNIKSNEVLVASTGVIGEFLPMDKIEEGIKKLSKELGNSIDHGKWAAEGIMTTDTFIKEMAVEINIGGVPIKIGAMAKGSGMIHPNMATMLSFVTTDINMDKELLNKALKESVEDSYNMISVDGDTSTNDMVILMASGQGKNDLINNEDEDYKKFKDALHLINTTLAKKIAKDGEGATKLIEVQVKGAISKDDGKKICKSILMSNLVKTAIYGEDPNWGRIIAAAGYSKGNFNPHKVDLSLSNSEEEIELMKDGTPCIFHEKTAKKIMESDLIIISIDLKEGNNHVKGWGCDFSHDYVKINASYRS